MIEPETMRPGADIRPYDVPALLMFGGLTFVVSLQFVTRYVLNDSLAWTEEIARYLLLGVTFFGAISLIPRGEQIAVELIFRRSDALNAKILAIAGELFGVIYYFVFAMSGLVLALHTEQMLISVPVPKALVYAFLSVAILACAGFSARRLMTFWKMPSRDVQRTFEVGSASEDVGDG